MPDSNRLRQERHRNAHPDRERARQIAKRARTEPGAGKVSARKCAMASQGGCSGRVEAHHSAGYGEATKVVYLCKQHHEYKDSAKH